MLKFAWSACAVVAVVLLSAPVMASPWTLPSGDATLQVSFDYSSATEEWVDGRKQSFPLDGRFTSSTIRFDARYGFAERFEVAAELNLKDVAYKSDPVVLVPPEAGPDGTVTRQAAQDAVFDFSASDRGLADIYLIGRYKLVDGPVKITSETSVKLPSGYQQPSGTFVTDDEGNPRVGSDFVSDDVALGDGQTDVSQAFLLGTYVPQTRSFVRMDLGYRLRLNEPGDQVFGAFKAGQFIGEWFVLFAGVGGDLTVIEGEPIGVSFVAKGDNVTADNIDPATDIQQVKQLLDKDQLKVEGGVTFLIDPVELQFAYTRALIGSNLPVLNTVTVGTTFKFF